MQTVNVGAERNFRFLYEQAHGSYVWVVGDDDVLVPGQFDQLIEDLERYRPEVCVSSFKQPPFSDSDRVFMCGGSSVQLVREQKSGVDLIAKYPKITAFVLKRYHLSEDERDVTDRGLETSYWIITMAIFLFLNKGRTLLVRSANIAACDSDYLDLRYSPRVFGTLRDAILFGVGNDPLAESYKSMPSPDVDGMRIGFMFRHCLGFICVDSNVAREELLYIRSKWRDLMFRSWKHFVGVAVILLLSPLTLRKKIQHF